MKRGKKIRKCSTCGRPTKGHIGRTGPGCTMGDRPPPVRPGVPPVNPPPAPGAGGRNVPQGPGQGGEGDGDDEPGPQNPPMPDDGNEFGPHLPGGVVPLLPAVPVGVGGPGGDPGDGGGVVPPVYPGGVAPAPGDGIGNVPPVFPGGGAPVMPEDPGEGAGGYPGGNVPVIPPAMPPVVPQMPPVVPHVPDMPQIPDNGGGALPIVPEVPQRPQLPPAVPRGGGALPIVPQMPQRPYLPPAAPHGGGALPVAPMVPQRPQIPPAVPHGGGALPVAPQMPQRPYMPPMDPQQPRQPAAYPTQPGAVPYHPSIPGQFPYPPYGPGAGAGNYGSGVGAVPGSGVSNNLVDMVNDCMLRLQSALQGQPRGPDINNGSMGAWRQPTNPGTAFPDLNGQYNPYGNHAGVGAYARQTARNPYVPGTMMHKMKAMGVPSKTIDMALEGDYVDLSDFMAPIGASDRIANPELEAVVDNNTNSITYRPKKYTRKIYNFDTWMQGWNNYEKLLVAYFGSALHEYMSDYRSFIKESSNKYVWHAVSVYDFRHRTRLATMVQLSDRLNFSATFGDTNNTVLDTTAIRPNAPRCLRCRAYDHLVQECPFPEIGKNEGQKKTQNQAQEVCNNFNREKCVTPGCKRRHVCQKCKGVLPYARCQVSGPCAGRSNITTSP